MKKIFTLMLLAVAAAGAMAQEGPYREGVHYEVIPQAASFQPGDTVEVAEAFSYLCNHCNTFEPYVQSWKERLPEGVTFRRLPVEFGRAIWGMYARAYITADVLGIADQSHPALMDAIWKNRRQMRSMDELAEFHSQFGVGKDRFLATANSFAVDMRMKREQQQVREFGITGTPSIVVNGKYRVSPGGAINTFDGLLAVVDHLVSQELAGAQPAAASTGASGP